MMKKRTRLLALAWGVAALALVNAAPIAAHPHEAEPGQAGDGQTIANGQLHPAFVNGVSCESFGTPGGVGVVGPAWYGLESAHHGPDAGTPGKGDGCYATTGGVPPAQDDENPALG